MTERRAAVLEAFGKQIAWCERLGSPFTARLLGLLAEDIAAGGPAAELAGHWPGDPVADALALRLAGALHALDQPRADLRHVVGVAAEAALADDRVRGVRVDVDDGREVPVEAEGRELAGHHGADLVRQVGIGGNVVVALRFRPDLTHPALLSAAGAIDVQQCHRTEECDQSKAEPHRCQRSPLYFSRGTAPSSAHRVITRRYTRG